jgi:hypothetical protein
LLSYSDIRATKLRGRERQETSCNVSVNIETEYSGHRPAFKTQISSQTAAKHSRCGFFFVAAKNRVEVFLLT